MNAVLTNIKSNWRAGLTVSLVSLPLSISLAVAANATPLMGVVTAIWAGLFAAIFGGSHYNVVGPTGALSGILAMYAVIHGVGVLPVLAILAGILILLCYVFHIDLERAEAAKLRAEELMKQRDRMDDEQFAVVIAKMEKELARLRVGKKWRNVGQSQN